MFDLDSLIRENIKKLKPYSSARDEFDGSKGVFLDANENPYGTYNRYPDPYQRELKAKIAKIKRVNADHVFIGNGSDEVIDLLYRIFCAPGADKALTFSPSYGMYDVSAGINDVELMKLPLTDSFQLDQDSIHETLTLESIKLIFICSPNNPTGNTIESGSIENLLSEAEGIVVIDEAYIDFSNNESWTKRLDEFSNLIVIQTMSKAWGLAGVRLGLAFSSPQIIQYLNKVKPPYNISSPNQEAGLEAITNIDKFQAEIDAILSEKKRMAQELETMNTIKKIYPSDANFLLVEVEDADSLYNKLVQQLVIIRNRNKDVTNCLRITVGTPEENNELLDQLRNLAK